jgi:hypothetical protein
MPVEPHGNPDGWCAVVLAALASHAAPDGTGLFPEAVTPMRRTGSYDRTVHTALGRLETAGIIRHDRRPHSSRKGKQR